jgi:hypothetical protein
MVEVKEAVNVEFHTVHVTVEAELLWSRISARLALEPGRAAYSEDKRDWMDKTLAFYDNFEWDLQVDNSNTSLPDCMAEVCKKVCANSEEFTRQYAMRLSAPSTPKQSTRPNLALERDSPSSDDSCEFEVRVDF